MDTQGPISPSSQGNSYIFVIFKIACSLLNHTQTSIRTFQQPLYMWLILL